MTLWPIAHQATLSMGFFRQEYWNGLPFPSPGDLPDPGIKPESPALADGCFTPKPPGKPMTLGKITKNPSLPQFPQLCNLDNIRVANRL